MLVDDRRAECIYAGVRATVHASKDLLNFTGKEVFMGVPIGCGDECPLLLAKQ